MGLDSRLYDSVKSQILNAEPMVNLRKEYAMVVREEGQHNVGLQRETKHESYRCNHCQKIGHDRSQCYEIIGYPPTWNTRRSGARSNHKWRPNSVGVTGRASHAVATHNANNNKSEGHIGLTMDQVNQLFTLFK